MGGGAVLFSLQPSAVIVNDINPDLIIAYEVIRDNVDLLVESLKKHINTPEYFYSIRSLDRNKAHYQSLSKIKQASRLIFLNKTCFNGLFRVNSSGEFNSPYGYYRNPILLMNLVYEPSAIILILITLNFIVKIFLKHFYGSKRANLFTLIRPMIRFPLQQILQAIIRGDSTKMIKFGLNNAVTNFLSII